MANLLEDLQGSILMESPTPSKKSGEKVTKEDLQATMMAMIRSMERNSIQIRVEVNRLYFLTGHLQRKLDLEYLTPENDHAKETMREASLVEELVIPLFPLLEKKRSEEENKEESENNQPVLKTIKEPELADPVLFLLDNREQCGSEIKQLLKEPQANVTIDANSLLQALVNMINLTCAEKEKGKGKATWEVKVERRHVDRPTE
ncbi:hypothetical protein ACFX1X_028762 [Malus domestica]